MCSQISSFNWFHDLADLLMKFETSKRFFMSITAINIFTWFS